jgi:hypothetical protein
LIAFDEEGLEGVELLRRELQAAEKRGVLQVEFPFADESVERAAFLLFGCERREFGAGGGERGEGLEREFTACDFVFERGACGGGGGTLSFQRGESGAEDVVSLTLPEKADGDGEGRGGGEAEVEFGHEEGGERARGGRGGGGSGEGGGAEGGRELGGGGSDAVLRESEAEGGAGGHEAAAGKADAEFGEGTFDAHACRIFGYAEAGGDRGKGLLVEETLEDGSAVVVVKGIERVVEEGLEC